MALLLRDREPSPATAAPPPAGDVHVVVPDYACAACGAGMQAGQDWCLECGTAAPGRLGARPGWRAAFTVVGLTTLLVVSAVIAGYAALTGDAEREAARPSSGSGNPIVAQTPPPAPATGAVPPGTAAPPAGTVVPPAGTTTPGVTPPTVATPKPKGGKSGPFVTLPGAGAAKPGNSGSGDPGGSPSTSSRGNSGNSGNPGSAPSSSGSSPSTSSPSSGRRPTATPAATVQAIAFGKGAMSTYDPYQRPGAEFGPAGNAADDDTGTVWDVTVPADGEALRVGLIVDLGAKYSLSSVKVSTPTPGFEMELYGSEGEAKPTDILDKRWEHLTDRKDVTDGATVSLQGKSDNKFRQVVLWFTRAKDAVDPRIAIGEVSVRGSR